MISIGSRAKAGRPLRERMTRRGIAEQAAARKHKGIQLICRVECNEFNQSYVLPRIRPHENERRRRRNKGPPTALRYTETMFRSGRSEKVVRREKKKVIAGLDRDEEELRFASRIYVCAR